MALPSRVSESHKFRRTSIEGGSCDPLRRFASQAPRRNNRKTWSLGARVSSRIGRGSPCHLPQFGSHAKGFVSRDEEVHGEALWLKPLQVTSSE